LAGLLAVAGRAALAGLLPVAGLLAVTGRVPVAGLLAVTGLLLVAGLLAVTGLLLVAGLLAVTGRVPVAGRVVPALRGHEHRDRVRGDRHGAAAGIPARALDDLVGAVGLHLVQPVVEPGHAVDRLGDRLVGGVEHRHEPVQRGVHVLADEIGRAHV